MNSETLVRILESDVSVRWMQVMLHFLWQGSLVGLVVAAALACVRRQSAAVRYATALVGLVLMAACVPVTWIVLDSVDDAPAPALQVTDSDAAAALPEVLPEHSALAVESDDTGAAGLRPGHVTDGRLANTGAVTEPPSPAGQPDEAVHSANRMRAMTPWLTAGYGLGVCLMLARLLLGLWGGHRLRRRSDVVGDSVVLQIAAEQAERLGLRVVPAIAECHRVVVPVVIGIVRPLILLPAGMVTGLESSQLSAVLGHELAHIRRNDVLINLLQRIVESLLFFHPAVWFVSRRVRAAREECCDDLVLAVGCQPLAYAGALLRMAELSGRFRRGEMDPQLAALSAAGNSRSEFSRRVRRLLGDTEPPRLNLTRPVGAALVLIASTAAFVSAAAPMWSDGDESDAPVSGRTSGETDSDPAVRQLRIRLTGGPEREPLPGLRVDLCSSPSKDRPIVASGRTDGTGELLLDVPLSLPRGDYRLEFTAAEETPYLAKSFALPPWPPVSETAEVEFHLPLTCALELKAVDVATGEGVPGVRFTRESAGAELWGIEPFKPDNVGPQRWVERRAGTTDDTGVMRSRVEAGFGWGYQVHTVPDGWELVRFDTAVLKTTPGGHVEHTFRFRRSGESNEKGPAAVSQPENRVVDAQGRPVSGAQILLRTSYRTDRGRPLGETVADDQGRFSYPPETPGDDRFYVIVIADGFRQGYWLGNRKVYRLENGVRQPDTLTLDRPVTVVGRIIGPDGNPLAGADIAVDYFVEGGPANINGTRVKSDAAGRFRAEGLPPANLFVRYEGPYDDNNPRRPVGRQPVKLSIAHFKATDGQVADDVVLDLRESRCVVEGTIVDENDKGVADRWINATLAAAAGRLDESILVQTDENGRFRFEGLAPDEYTIGTYSPGLRETVRPSADAPTQVRLTTYVRGRPAPERAVAPAWGKPDDRGLSTAVLLDPVRDTYSTGETLRAQLLVRNTTEETRIVRYTFSARAELQITDSGGGAPVSLNYGSFTGIAARQTYRLEPGQESFVGTFPFAFVKPGTSPPANATFTVPAAPGEVRFSANLSADVFGQQPTEGGLPATGELRIKLNADPAR